MWDGRSHNLASNAESELDGRKRGASSGGLTHSNRPPQLKWYKQSRLVTSGRYFQLVNRVSWCVCVCVCVSLVRACSTRDGYRYVGRVCTFDSSSSLD